MIIGLGVDLVAVPRIHRWMKQEKLLQRFFSSEEIENAKRKRDMAESLAGCMAAKEAFGKALGVGLFGLVLKDIMLLNDMRGKPILKVRNEVQTIMEQRTGTQALVSITHDAEYAVAVVVIEGDDG